MKKLYKSSIATVLVAFFAFVIMGLITPNTALAVAGTAPTLGAASTFAVMGFSAVTCTGATTVAGEVGVDTGSSITGFQVPCTTASGLTHINDASAINAQAAILTAYGQLAANPVGVALNLGINNTVTAGVYEVGAVDLNGSTLTLNGPGVYIFRSSSSLTDAAGGSTVILTNGATASNVFWQIPTSMSIGTGTQMVGTIIADTGAITLATGATLNGRALTKGTIVTLDANTITVPTYLHLRKTVDNTGGGVALKTDWTLTATGTGGAPTNLTGTTPVDSGTTFKADTYTLAESGGPVGYTASTYSCVKNGGAAVVSNSITLAAGDEATCTITNTYDVPVAPILNLVKVIVGGSANFGNFILTANGTGANDFSGPGPLVSPPGLLPDTFALSETNPGNYTASAWSCIKNLGVPVSGPSITLANGDIATCTITNTYVPPSGGGSFSPVPPLIDVVKVPNPLSLPSGAGTVNYGYTLTNIGTVPVANVTMVDDSCSPLTLTSGDSNSDAILDLTETWKYNCSTNITATHTNIVTATGWANGVSATDIASATVVVGIPVVPPLIHITKVPNPLTLGTGGGMVTYTKRVTNPGTVPLSNVRVTDNKCSPINYISGDANSNSMLEPSETWVYTCQANLTTTTTNTAIATGTANGLTATDFAIATVVVANAVAYTIPSLPNTGVAPMLSVFLWSTIGLVALLLSIYIIRKKQTK